MIVTAAGNVGIGTTSPREKLDVDGDIVTTWGNDRFVGLQYQQGAAYQNGLLLHGDNRSTGLIAKGGTGSTPYIWFGVSEGGNTERMRITKDGNVGIGTTSPGTKLHLADTSDVYLTLESTNTSLSEEAAIKYSNFNTGANYWWQGLNQSENWSLGYGTSFSSSTTKLFVSTSGNVGIGTTSPQAALHVNSGVANTFAVF